MLLEPQALAQHFPHGIANRVGVVPGDCLDLGAGGAQARLQGVGCVQEFAHGALAAARAAQDEQAGGSRGDGEQDQQNQGRHGEVRAGGPQSAARPGAAANGPAQASPNGRFPCRIKQFAPQQGLT